MSEQKAPEDPTAGPIFVLGAPRSGTTWLQQLLGSHPEVASPQESHLFPSFIRPLNREWERQLQRLHDVASDLLAGRTPRDRLIGLPTILTGMEFDQLLREMTSSIFSVALDMKPGARVVVEKTPGNSRLVPLIVRLFPEACFIHIIRNPYSVTASLLAAAGGWGVRWAPSSAVKAAQVWRSYYEGALAARTASQYHEVRYEELCCDPCPTLIKAFAACGITVSSEEATCILESVERTLEQEPHAVPSLLVGGQARLALGDVAPREPTGFRRSPTNARGLSPMQRFQVCEELGDVLEELGYGDNEGWAAVPKWRRLAYRRLRQPAIRLRRNIRRQVSCLLRKAALSDYRSRRQTLR